MSKKKKQNQIADEENRLEHPDFIIYTDGGCAVNPGGPGGCAAVIIDTSTGEIAEKSEGYLSTTNNRMEMMAMILAFKYLPEHCSVEFYSDSQYLIKTLLGMFQKKKNLDLWKQIDQVVIGKEISYNWVRGHVGVPENERCDSMCQEAMRRSDRKVDAGYEDQREAGREFYGRVEQFQESKKTGAMGEIITIPDDLRDEQIPILPIKEYCQRYQVTNTCASGIRNFEASGKNFKSYLLLKTGGIDAWSRKKKEMLLDILVSDRGYTKEKASLVWEIICNHISSEKMQVSCLRWYLRGLPLYHCIRREFVAAEVAENCI
mgnify:CR=1 FL=1